MFKAECAILCSILYIILEENFADSHSTGIYNFPEIKPQIKTDFQKFLNSELFMKH